jgi:hypothetical protein
MTEAPVLIPSTGFAYLPDTGKTFSRGVIALEGHTLHRVTLNMPMEAGLLFAANFIKNKSAFCACELRTPTRLTQSDFAVFNQRFIAALQAAGLPTDPTNPAARTNMVPTDSPTDAILYAFTFATPGISTTRDFVISGKPEIDGTTVIAPNDTSQAGMQAKAQFVIDDLKQTAQQLGADWASITAAHIYTSHPIDTILPLFEGIAVTHIPGDPPVSGPDNIPFEFEADIRAITHEQTI